MFVVCDEHDGLRAAIGKHFPGCIWQGCQVQLMRKVLSHIPASLKAAMAAGLKRVLAAETQASYADSPGSTWCISAPQTITVTKTNSRGGMTRETDSSAGFDTAHCRPTQTVVAQGTDTDPAITGTASAVTTSYSYDSWGNAKSVIVSGGGTTLRETDYYDGGTHGEYPNTVTRYVTASGSQTLLSSAVWNSALGVQTSLTDPNGHTVSFSYDGLGRRTSEALPDGVVRSWTYTCAFRPWRTLVPGKADSVGA